MVMRPFSTPKASSSTLTMGTKQLVVHEALDTTWWASGSKVSSLTPITKVASAPVAGAEMITRGAPASRWAAALSRSVKKPVDSTTTSTPRSPQGRALGSRSAVIWSRVPSTSMPLSVATTCGVEATHHRVVLEQVGHLGHRAQVVGRDDLDVGPRLAHRPEEVAADATESVDADANGHVVLPPWLRYRSRSERPYPIMSAGRVPVRRRPGRAGGHHRSMSRWVTFGS